MCVVCSPSIALGVRVNLDDAGLVDEQVLWLEVTVQDATLVAVQDGAVDLVQVTLHHSRAHQLKTVNTQ